MTFQPCYDFNVGRGVLNITKPVIRTETYRVTFVAVTKDFDTEVCPERHVAYSVTFGCCNQNFKGLRFNLTTSDATSEVNDNDDIGLKIPISAKELGCWVVGLCLIAMTKIISGIESNERSLSSPDIGTNFVHMH